MGYTYVFSDVHLFSKICKPRVFINFLKMVKSDGSRVIILGDLFDGDDFNCPRGNNKNHIKCLGHLRDLVDSGIDLVWVEGNHDINVIEFFAPLIGSRIIFSKDFYIEEIGGVSYLFIHGHQFDTFISSHPLITYIATWIYSLIQYFDGHKFTVSRWVKRKSKTFLSVCKSNKDRALKFARKHEVDFIVCGHTHVNEVFIDNDVVYINTGCWVDYDKTYLKIDECGKFFLKNFIDGD